MGISELLSKIGDDNLKVQYLDNCITYMCSNKNNVSKITFGTDQNFDFGGNTKDFGIVIWVSRKDIDSILKG